MGRARDGIDGRGRKPGHRLTIYYYYFVCILNAFKLVGESTEDFIIIIFISFHPQKWIKIVHPSILPGRTNI